MADVGRLANGLAGYHEALVRSLDTVGESYDELEQRYRALAQTYQGQGAAEFAQAWTGAGRAMQAYIEGVPALGSLLDDAVQRLRGLDQGLGG